MRATVSPAGHPDKACRADHVAMTTLASPAHFEDPVATLRRAATIRTRCRAIADAVTAGDSPHFTVHRAKLDDVADRVAAITRARFPTLAIPYHSRWRHFEAGGVDRKGELDALLAGRSKDEVARARIDLTVVSVLLDAGAGPGWRYVESIGDRALPHARSEGLAVATFRAFVDGAFSSDPDDPCRVDARALARLDAVAIASIFQATERNPLLGIEGRAELMQRLALALAAHPDAYGDDLRPGRLFDALRARLPLTAEDVLRLLLDTLSPIWPSGQSFDGVPVGDVWPHPQAGGDDASRGLVPFHKLSQWLTYSLLEPFDWAGVPVGGLDALTGLPEYRNGGLLLDDGVLVARDPARLASPMAPADPWIVEWRALTVALLDELAPRVRERLGVDAQALPLACMLEGGTWFAGREVAALARPGGVPPVTVASDGTVF